MILLFDCQILTPFLPQELKKVGTGLQQKYVRRISCPLNLILISKITINTILEFVTFFA